VGTYNTIGVLKGPSPPSAAKADEASPEIVVTAQELSKLDALQMLLDVIGLIPGFGAPADILNAVISGARGDWLGAGLSVVGVVPVAGEAATAGKIAKNADRYAAAAAKVADEVLPHLPARVQDKLRPAIEAAKKKIDELGGRKPDAPARPPEVPMANNAGGGRGKKVKERRPGPCDHLRQGNGNGPYRGGAHGKTSKPRNDQRDSHHMPAKDASPLAEDDGPAIQMTQPDHRKTKSNGSQPGSAKFRQSIAALLAEGRWREAMVKEIKDIRRIQRAAGEPGKYNEAMLEMLEYFKCLEKNGLLK
jgi:hypothetical protein